MSRFLLFILAFSILNNFHQALAGEKGGNLDPEFEALIHDFPLTGKCSDGNEEDPTVDERLKKTCQALANNPISLPPQTDEDQVIFRFEKACCPKANR